MVAYAGGRIEIGNRVFINYGASISAHQRVRIGDGCQLGSYACLMDNDYHCVEDRTRAGESKPIVLGRNVWLGVRVIVLKGVTIGDHAVIGAGSVVNRDVPDYALMVGVPARQIGWMSQYGEKLDLPLQGSAETKCKQTNLHYTLKEGRCFSENDLSFCGVIN